MEREQRAFFAAGTNRNAKELDDIIARERINIAEGFADEFFTEHRHRRLTDRASHPLPPDARNALAVEREADTERVAAAEVHFLMRDRRIDERLLGTGVPVVVENVLGVEVHRRHSTLSAEVL